MRSGLGKWALTGAAIAAASFALSPAVSAVTDLVKLRAAHPVSLGDLGSISSFTPATHDSRLAQAYARIVASGSHGGFRFTPTSGSVSGRRSITIAVRADGDHNVTERTAPAGLSVAPFAYNLGFARGLTRFTLDDSVGRKPLDPIPAQIGTVGNFSLPASKPQRLTASMSLADQRPTGSAPQTLAGEKTYSVDVTSSYRLTRNIDVMAGLRYRGPGNRAAPLTDERQDSQAVYVGTAFRF